MTSTPPDWSSLIDQVGDLSATWFRQLSLRAKVATQKANDGTYDRDAWFEDVAWFYRTLADNTADAAKACNDLYPKQRDD